MSEYFVDKADCRKQTIFSGVDIRTAAGKEMMLSAVDIEPGAIVEAHSHPHEQVGMVLSGRAIFYVGDTQKELGPGDMYIIPGGVTHRVVALDEHVQALDIFHPVREDYL